MQVQNREREYRTRHLCRCQRPSEPGKASVIKGDGSASSREPGPIRRENAPDPSEELIPNQDSQASAPTSGSQKAWHHRFLQPAPGRSTRANQQARSSCTARTACKPYQTTHITQQSRNLDQRITASLCNPRTYSAPVSLQSHLLTSTAEQEKVREGGRSKLNGHWP